MNHTQNIMQLYFFSVAVCCLVPTKCSTVEVSCSVVPEQRQYAPYSMVEKSGFLFYLRVASGAKICVECYSNQCVLKTSSFFFSVSIFSVLCLSRLSSISPVVGFHTLNKYLASTKTRIAKIFYKSSRKHIRIISGFFSSYTCSVT